jgi:uncharacterized membrane protein
MIKPQQMKNIMGTLLLLGTLLSACLVGVGGILYLIHYGNDPIPTIFPTQVWQFDFSFTPIGLIKIGLLALVVVQILRVSLLCGFYIATRDYWFSLISSFILFVLIYSVFWRA